MGDTFPAFWILISPFFRSHCLAATDGTGNRLTRTLNGATGSYSYQSGTSRLLAVASSEPRSFTLDAAGYTTALDGRGLAYDPAGRLSQVTQGAQTLGAYGYDAYHRRVVKTAGAETRLYHYDQQGQLLMVRLWGRCCIVDINT